MRNLVSGGVLACLMAAGPIGAGAEELISLETDANVTTKGLRRQLDPEQAAARAKLKRVEQTMSGIVVARGINGMAFSPRLNASGEPAPELWLLFEPGLKLIGYRALTDINAGDMVNVTYEEITEDHERFLKKITLIQRAAEGGP